MIPFSYRSQFLIPTDCERTLDIVNRGLSGYNTAMELVILEHLIPSPSFAKVDYLLIMFGANDSCLPSSPSKQHVPIDKYKENLRAIITHPSVQAHKPKIILVCPPPINEHQLASGNLALTRSAKTTALYSGAVGELAGDLVAEGIDNIVYINFWYAITKKAMELDKPTPDSRDSNCDVCSLEKPDSPGLRSLLVDGLHLTGAGYQVLLEKVSPILDDAIEVVTDGGIDSTAYWSRVEELARR